ncbi:ATP-grasp domain-containing protein [Loigolactobacillus coryniformis]|uniref:ATP-grasp domain-containing protein n=1 Tax=Loigolactobacillus coryniformis TaxID=1610 RepID=UPI00345CA0BD
MKQTNVLVYPADTEIGLEINNALKYIKSINLVGLSPTDRHGSYVYDDFTPNFPDPSHDQRFIDHLSQFLQYKQIDFIFPASDDLALFLSEHEAELPATVIGSPLVTTRIARSKRKTYTYFTDYNWLPRYYTSPAAIDTYPVFIKPDIGAGSEGARMIHSPYELKNALAENIDYLISDYLPGQEYTIDCFTDRLGQLRFAGFRERRRTKNGISVNATNLPLPAEVANIANELNKQLDFRGAWFFQVKKDRDGNYKLMEIATRIAGTMCLYRNQGINLPLLCVLDRLHQPIKIQQNQFDLEVDRALSNKFKLNIDYQTVLVDFDDTITRQEKINPLLMYLLYQFQNEHKTIVLITRHAHDIQATLAQLSISQHLFHEIHHLQNAECKGKITAQYPQPIFIDDSFGERQTVLEQANCPVFDVSAIESLVKWY